jgi:phosphatidylserine/phosphatidylglycerophosphate/cardiolipin synthase-like enzyme
MAPSAGYDSLYAIYLEEDGQSAEETAALLAGFVETAKQSIDIAIYDCRLTDGPAALLRNALAKRASAGVQIRVVYDAGEKPETTADVEACGLEPVPKTTHERLEELGLPDASIRAIMGERALMHHKYVIVDGRRVWTGSLNLSDDSMRRMENMIVTLTSEGIARDFTRDFEQLWSSCQVEASGKFATSPHVLTYEGAPAPTDVDFSPGQGEAINELIAQRVAQAKNRIVICSMLFTSSRLLGALSDHVARGTIAITGVYDGTQMEGVLNQWRGRDDLAWKIKAVEDVISYGKLIGKPSTPYRPGRSHNFFHVKTLVVDDVVLTGSHNFSHAAQANAENVLSIKSAALAEHTVQYAHRLAHRYRNATTA